MRFSANQSVQSVVEAFLAATPQLSQAVVPVLTIDTENGPEQTELANLQELIRMGLGHLPAEAVSIPYKISSGQARLIVFRQQAAEPTVLDFSKRLTHYFPSHFVAALLELQSLFNRLGSRAYVIGGVPRNLILQQAEAYSDRQDVDLSGLKLHVKDVDVTIEGDALAAGEWILAHSKNFQLEDVFPEFGTMKIRYKNTMAFDLASTRQEHYTHCGALPVVTQRGVPLSSDLFRRDFTMNTLALSLNDLGQLLDYVGGVSDLEAGYIQLLHPVSFYEDPSRILRALKFASRLSMQLAPETAHLLEKFLRFQNQCRYKGGGERIRAELRSFLVKADSPLQGHWLGYFATCGGMKLLHAELHYTFSATLQTALRTAPQRIRETMSRLKTEKLPCPELPELSWQVLLCLLAGSLFQDTPDYSWQEELLKLGERLGLTKAERHLMEECRNSWQSRKLLALTEDSSPVEVYETFKGQSVSGVVAQLIMLPLLEHKAKGQAKIVWEAWLSYLRKWQHLKPELTGEDLLKLGVPAGETVGNVLKQLLYGKIAGQLPTKMAEEAFVRLYLESSHHPVYEQPI